MRKFNVTGMTCAACSARVEKAVKSLKGIETCEVNLLLGTMAVSGSVEDREIICAVEKAGYGIRHADESSAKGESDFEEESYIKEQRLERQGFFIKLVSSVALLLFLMYVSMGHVMWGAPLPTAIDNPLAIGLAELVISAVILVINKHFFINGIKGIVHSAPNMDTLVSLGSGASFIYSLVQLFIISGNLWNGNKDAAMSALHGLYFESAAMILVLISVGKLLESVAKGKTTNAIKELMMLTPQVVTVERGGAEVIIPAKELKVGDIIVVRQGENISADGSLVFGEGTVNESMLTGESLPVDKTVGSGVFGGTTLLSGFIKVRAEMVGEDTALSEIVKMVKDASGSKASVAKIADKVSGFFVPVVIGIAMITSVIWLLLGSGVGYAVSRGVSVLVISCPCALGLATPVAIMVGSGVGARCGILFKNATALELSGRVKTVVLDKTGTITEGKPYVSGIYPISSAEGELVALAASLENMSEHPLARAIVEYAEENGVDLFAAEGFKAELGGVFGIVNGRELFCGNEKYIEAKISGSITPETKKLIEELSGKGGTPLILAEGERLLGVIALSDRIKAGSVAAVEGFKRLGIKTVMLTGDNESCAAAVARTVGIDEFHAGIFPADKAELVKKYRENGRVCMVGDGINDAPALTLADVGIAIGRGAHIAVDSADVVLSGGELTSALDAVRLGRRTLKNIYLNLFWAFCYNIVGIPLAAGAFTSALGWSMSPMFGALAMSLSSFLVVMSSLSINLFSSTKIKKNINEIQENVNQNSQNKGNADKETEKMENKVTIKIEGMMCPHCSGRVKAALENMSCVESADVSHERGDAIITVANGCELSELEKCITDAGYKVIR